MSQKEIRNRYRFIPFGKFAASGRGKPPYNQTMVGRSKERARLIEMLTHQQEFGAFLVSGRRGSGKTSFVKYCLEQYERSAFQRLVRFSRNTIFSDLLAVIAVCIGMSVLFVVASQLINFFSLNALLATFPGQEKYLWTMVPIFFIGLFSMMLIPIQINLVRALAGLFERPEYVFIWIFFGVLAAVIYPIVSVVGSDHFKNWKSIQSIIETIEPIYLIGGSAQVISSLWVFQKIWIALLDLRYLKSNQNELPSSIQRSNGLKLVFAIVIAVISVWLFSLDALGLQKESSGNSGSETFTIFRIVLASSVLAFILFSEFIGEFLRTYSRNFGTYFGIVVTSLIVVMFVSFAFLDNFTIAIVKNFGLSTLFIAGLVLLGFGVQLIRECFFFADEEREAIFKRHRSNYFGTLGFLIALTMTKIILLSVVLVCFLAPIINGFAHFVMMSDTTILQPVGKILGIYLSSDGTLVDTHFFRVDGWFSGCAAILLFVLFVAEYSWVSKALSDERQDHALIRTGPNGTGPNIPFAWSQFRAQDVGKNSQEEKEELWSRRKMFGKFTGQNLRKANYLSASGTNAFADNRPGLWTRRREAVQAYEETTLPHLYYRSRLPILSIWTNLGFENLEHSQVIEAMIVELRRRYAHRFTSLSSTIGILSWVFTFLILGLLTKIFASALFHISPIEFQPPSGRAYNDISINYVSSPQTGVPVPGQVDYCGFFEVNPEYAPAIYGPACLFPFGNALIRAIYAPVAPLSLDFQVLKTAPFAGSAIEIVRLAPPDNLEVKKTKDTVCISGEERRFCVPNMTNTILSNFFLDRHYSLPYIEEIGGTPGGLFAPKDPDHRLIPYHANDWEPAYGSPTAGAKLKFEHQSVGRSLTLHVYHFLALFLAFFVVNSINGILRILPYNAHLAEMDDLLNHIRGQVTKRKSYNSIQGFFQRLLGVKSGEEETMVTPDARVIEQRFLSLLGQICQRRGQKDLNPSSLFQMRPEIVFIFDEMDKLSGRAQADNIDAKEAKVINESHHRERQRTRQLHELLSNMKRLISTGDARFIFIGGRNYHDEWLADSTNRQPLLTSIFNGQIYLPSLLTDRSHPYGRFNDRIAEFFVLMFRNANHRFAQWSRVRSANAFMAAADASDATFVQAQMPYSGHHHRLLAMANDVGLSVRDEMGEAYGFYQPVESNILYEKQPYKVQGIPLAGMEPQSEGKQGVRPISLGEAETIEQLLNFLTYRSAGTPKKVKELMQDLALPAGHALSIPKRGVSQANLVRWQKFRDCHDVLVLDDKSLFRIQFIDLIYRHLAQHLESPMLERDDKVAMSIFYLMDFLLKFHKRAFSWNNLQRVDELSHIHRAPDLRSMMETLVEMSSQRFLHRILHGIHGFRFRSEMAAEIDYLSRLSKDEMAALNFTLDESQSLKALYQETIRTGERVNTDTISGLGELYEYDQEYEIARNYYRRGLTEIDDEVRQAVMQRRIEPTSVDDKDGMGTYWSPLGVVQNGGDPARQLLRAQLPWAMTRLRLMLQIALTYEQERNLERALASYMHAGQFSLMVMTSLWPDDGMPDFDTWQEDTPGSRYYRGFSLHQQNFHLNTKNFALLYQAGMAAAWVMEKSPENVDDSHSHARRALLEIEARLPKPIGLQNPSKVVTKWSKSGDRIADNSQLFLNASEMSNKVGDLLFYKGRQAVDHIRVNLSDNEKFWTAEDLLDEEKNPFPYGFTVLAHQYYANAIFYVRRYLALRHERGSSWLEVHPDQDKKVRPAFNKMGSQPELVHSLLANSMTDLSEATLARLDLRGLFYSGDRDHYKSLKLKRENWSKEFRTQVSINTLAFMNWLFGEDNDTSLLDRDLHQISKKQQSSVSIAGIGLKAGTISDWFGKHSGSPKSGEETGSDLSNPQIANLTFGDRSPSYQRLNAYFFLSQWAVHQYRTGGYNHNTSRELLLQAETYAELSQAMANLRWMSEHAKDIQADEGQGLTYVAKVSQLFDKPKSRHAIDLGQMAHYGAHVMSALRVSIRYSYREQSMSATMATTNHGDPKKMADALAGLLQEFYGQKLEAAELISNFLEQLRLSFLKIDSAAEREKYINVQLNPKIFLRKLLTVTNAKTSSSKSDKEIADFVDQNCSRIRQRVLEILVEDNRADEYSDDYFLSQKYRDIPEIMVLSSKWVLAASYMILEAINSQKITSELLANIRATAGLIREHYFGILLKYGNGSFAQRPGDPYGLKDGFHYYVDSPVHEIEYDVAKLSALTFTGLRSHLERYRFPILNRLNGLSTLLHAGARLRSVTRPRPIDPIKEIDPSGLRFKPDEGMREIGRRLSMVIGPLANELAATAATYRSELHFTPYKLGSAMAMAYFYMKTNGNFALYEYGQAIHFQDGEESNQSLLADDSLSDVLITREYAHEYAEDTLRKSQQMFSMGRAYYDSFAHMNYLHDDFNDRLIHYSHAQQMMFAEYIALVSNLIEQNP